MAFYVNEARLSEIKVGGVDVTDRVIEWTCSDSSANNQGCIQTTGTLKLGQESGIDQIKNLKRNKYKRGLEVIVKVQKVDQSIVRHPRGLLYVISSSWNPDEASVSIELGCRITLANITGEVAGLLALAPLPLDPAQEDFASISNSFAAAGQYVYQDNTGSLVTGDFFEGNTFGVVSPGSWVSIYGATAFTVTPLQASGVIPDVINLQYEYPEGALSEDNTGKIDKNTTKSDYFVQYPGTVYIRTNSDPDAMPPGGSVEAPNPGYSNPCGNSPTTPGGGGPDKPNSCSSTFQTEKATITQPATRKETSETHYDAIGAQVSYRLQEVRGPALEINQQYFADAYQACRYQYATACNPGGNCPLDGMETVLQTYTEEFYSYDGAGTLVTKTVDNYKNQLAAAQPFNWRAGNVDGNVQGFTALTTLNYYLSTRVITEYEENENINKETTTTYTSIAESGSGLGITSQDFAGATTELSEAKQTPKVNGNFSNLSTQTNGSGSGMVLDVIMSGAGAVTKANVNEFEITEIFPFSRTGNGVPVFGGTGTGMKVNYFVSQYNGELQEFEWSIVDPGTGYTVNDIVTVINSTYGEPINFKLKVKKTTKPTVSATIKISGEDYYPGDSVWVTSDSLYQAGALNAQGQGNLVFEVLDSTDSAQPNSDGGSASNFDVNKGAPPLIANVYRALKTTTESNGSGLTVDMYVTESGSVVKLGSVQTPPVPYPNTPSFNCGWIKGPTTVSPTGGSGSGLMVAIRFNQVVPDSSNPNLNVIDCDHYQVAEIIDPGSGYKQGDQVEISAETIRSIWKLTAVPSDAQPWILEVNKNGPTNIELYPSQGGANYEKGDVITITGQTLMDANATNATQIADVSAKVTKIVKGLAASNISISAMNGVKTRVINKSATITTLPIVPDTVNNPTTSTSEGTSRIVLRKGTVDTSSGIPEAVPYVQDASIPVPLLLTDGPDIAEAVTVYSRYLESFVLGDALGLQIVESLRDEIVDNWKPGLSFRYFDPPTNRILAMRMDAVTWGISPTETALSTNAIYLGQSNGTVQVPGDGGGALNNTVGDATPIINEPDPSSGNASGAGSSTAVEPPPPVPQPPQVDQETAIDQGDFLMDIEVYISLSQIQTELIGPGISIEKHTLTISDESQLVVYLTGQVVEDGDTLAVGPGGSIPYSYDGSLLTTDAVILEEIFD